MSSVIHFYITLLGTSHGIPSKNGTCVTALWKINWTVVRAHKVLSWNNLWALKGMLNTFHFKEKKKHFFLPLGRLAKVCEMKYRWPQKTVNDMVNLPTVRIHLSTRLFCQFLFFLLSPRLFTIACCHFAPLLFMSFCYFILYIFLSSICKSSCFLTLPYFHMCSMTPFDLHGIFNSDWWPGLTSAHEDLSSFLLFCLFFDKVALFLTPSHTMVLFAL